MGFKYIDLFAGAGGLSEGFIKAGFEPVAHVELDKAACLTLKTRAARHYLKSSNKYHIYVSYLKGEITRNKLYESVPDEILECVINAKIGNENEPVFKKIDSFLKKDRVDLIIGGPPCQAYSYIGRAALKHKKEDERTTLYVQYGRFLKKYRPKIFVFENVPGLLNAGGGKYFKNLQKYYKTLGYTVEVRQYNAFDHGVVQHRNRLIIIGWQKNLSLNYPEISKSKTKHLRNEIFSDLPAIGTAENSRFAGYTEKPNDYLLKSGIRNGLEFVTQHITRPHNDKDLNIYRMAIDELEKGQRLKNNKIPEEHRTQKNVVDFLDRFKVVSDEPHTMIAHISKDGHHFIHPDQNQLRSISVREAARIQSFPDDFYFEGIKENQTRTPAFRQIGNAVPPVLAYKIAKRIKALLNEKTKA